jgi:glycerol-3-phosphate O-acyltransferase / dihydroxyacetone phosphate acyltransferase
LSISTGWTAFGGLVTAVIIIYANASDMAYFAVRVFLQSIMSIFFSSIEVLGRQNIPAHGPIIFTGNHMNQFVDAALILVTCPHRVGFLIAEKSFNTKVIGGFAKLIGCYPVSRPQDHARKGLGRICFVDFTMLGEGTDFTQLHKGDKIRPGRSPDAYRIKEIVSDTEVLLADDFGEPSPRDETSCQGEGNWVSYDILDHIDQGKVFDIVQEALSKGNNLGIFPEGGSHDNTDLLPLKVGCWLLLLH